MAKSRLAVLSVLLLSLFGLSLALGPAVATPEVVTWSEVSIPTEGGPGGWVLADGSDAGLLTMAGDGSLYAYVSGLGNTLFKSADEGHSWQESGSVTAAIVALATSQDDDGVIYYATSASVYKSTDGGHSFFPLAANPGGAGSNNIEITAIDVGRLGDSNIVVIGTRDGDAGEYGGVYILDEGQPFTNWQDTSLSGFDVYAVAFSPHFATDHRMVAVVTDETDSFVTTNLGGAGWGVAIGDARLDKDNSGASVVVAVSAAIAFPADHSSDPVAGLPIQFVAIDSGDGSGDVYMVYSVMAPSASVAIDLNIGANYGQNNTDVTSLEVSGSTADAHLLAGAAASGQIYYSSDGGAGWVTSLKEPSGDSRTYVLMATDFLDSGRAYAATSGSGSALSATLDGGASWNQLALIDTAISSIVDLAVSPRFDQDSTMFMLTWGSGFSLWRTLNNGLSWQRIFSSYLAGVDSLDMVQLSPRYGSSSWVVFIAGVWGGNPAIWRSADNGQSFSRRSAPLAIDQWAAVDDTTLFVGSFDGSNGLVYHTSNSGLSYSAGVAAGSQSLSSFVLSPNYDQDGIILVGNTNGWVYWSSDNGASFEPLPPTAASPPLDGNVRVAFDPQFASNNTVYAASDAPDKGIYRYIVGTSTGWQRIDSTLPAGGMIGQLAVSADGVLYGVNFQQVDIINQEGGLERCLSPGATFETVTRGLGDGVTLWGLWLHGDQLWSIDTTGVRLMTYTDSLTQPPTLASPLNQAPGIGVIINNTIAGISLDWEPLNGATSYQWQIDDDNDFTSVPAGFEGTTASSSVHLPVLQPATTYYWRVRASGPVLSPWSARWSFTTSLGGSVVTLSLVSPSAGARDVPVRPLFQWSAIAGAEGYELVVSGDYNFASPSILRIGEYALPGTAWQSDIALNYYTTYYWKVRAVSSSSSSAWSAIYIFITEPEPAPEPAPSSSPSPGVESPSSPSLSPPSSPPPPPLPQQSSATPDWAVYLMGLMGLVIMLLLITIVVMAVRRY